MSADFLAADPWAVDLSVFVPARSRLRFSSQALRSSLLASLVLCLFLNSAMAHTTDDYEVLDFVDYYAPFATDESETYTEIWATGDYAYLGSAGSGVAILDTSDTSNVSTVGVFGASTGDGFYDIRVDGNVGYFSTDTSGTYVVDLTVPTAPTTLTTISAAEGGFDSVTNAYVYGDRLYQVSATSGDIAVFDITSPATPSYLTSISTGDSIGVYDLTISDDRLYAAGLGGTTGNGAAYIYEIQSAGAGGYSLVTEVTTGENTASVAPNNDHTALIVTHREIGGTIAGWDITDPTAATLLEEIDVSDVGLSAYSASQVTVLGDLAYVAWNQAGVQVIDLEILQDTDTIYRVGAYGTSTASPLDGYVGNQHVFVSDHGEVYLTDSRWGLFLVDASNVAGYNLGDFDGSSFVDAADLQAWSSNYGLTDLADADADGDSDGDDFLSWQTGYGSSVGPAFSVALVPEPSAMTLVLLLMVVLCFDRSLLLPRV